MNADFLSSFAEWANKNNGLMMVTLTFVYVVATLIMAYFSWNANRISLRNLNQVLQIEKERSRPYLIFDIEHSQSLLYATIKNLGSTGAFNVKVKITPKLESNFGGSLKESSLTSKSIAFISPQRTISDLVGSGPEFYRRYSEPLFQGAIEYSDSLGKEYSDSFAIDLDYLLNIAHTVEPDVGKEMQKLVKEVRDLSKTAERMRESLRLNNQKENI